MGIEKTFDFAHLQDTSALQDFYCGVPMMDDFLHSTFQDSIDNHYCNAYSVTLEGTLVAVFALSFDSLSLDADDLDEIFSGISSAGKPDVASRYLEIFKSKKSYPALEITYLAVNKDYRHQGIGQVIIDSVADMAREQNMAGCQFLSVEALKIEPYSAVGFYDKCDFAPCELPLPHKDTLRMFRTLYPKQ